MGALAVRLMFGKLALQPRILAVERALQTIYQVVHPFYPETSLVCRSFLAYLQGSYKQATTED